MAKFFAVRITGQEKVKKQIDYLRRNFPDWLAAANLETAYEVRDLALQNIRRIDAYDTGELYSSMQVSVSPQGRSVRVLSTAKYAPFIEFGTRPHFPPLEPIRKWCSSRGIDESAAFPIARAIAEHGTPERPFLAPAFKTGTRNHIKRIRQYAKQGMQGLLG